LSCGIIILDYTTNEKGTIFLNQFQIFIIRAIVGVLGAIILARIFFGKVDIVYVAGLAIILVGLAYFSEYLRNRRSD